MWETSSSRAPLVCRMRQDRRHADIGRTGGALCQASSPAYVLCNPMRDAAERISTSSVEASSITGWAIQAGLQAKVVYLATYHTRDTGADTDPGTTER